MNVANCAARMNDHGHRLPVTAILRPQEQLNYLNDEVLRLIVESREDGHFNHVTAVRFAQLLTQVKVHFGPDPENPCFRRYLRQCLKYLNHKVALMLINEGYVTCDHLIDYQPDFLFLLFYYVLENRQQFTTDPGEFLELVKKLEKCSSINCYVISHWKSTLELIINCVDSDIAKSKTLLGTSALLAFDYVTKLEHFDANLNGQQEARSPLQVALDETKYQLANVLIRKGACANHIRLDDVIFTRSCRKTLQLLYEAGCPFPSAKELRNHWALFEDDPYLDVFLRWLTKQQRGVLPLTCLAWRQLRRQLGVDAIPFYKQLAAQFNFPRSFDNYVHLKGYSD